jgi:hypothetical protein
MNKNLISIVDYKGHPSIVNVDHIVMIDKGNLELSEHYIIDMTNSREIIVDPKQVYKLLYPEDSK